MSLIESKDFSLVATATTLKLFLARIKEISFPIPLDPPVTIAVFVEKLSVKQFYKFSILL